MVGQGGTTQRLARALAGLAFAASACSTASPSPTSSGSASSGPSASEATGASAAPSTPLGARPDIGFATVTADQVNMRLGPSINAAGVPSGIADCPAPCAPLQVGQATTYPELYLLDGPVQADGFAWYLAATATEHAIFTEYVGWVAAGDASGPWLVRHAPTCPKPPIELGDITFTGVSRFEAIACFGRQPLTVRGWYVELPPDAEVNTSCDFAPGWLVCGYGYHMLRPQESDFYGDANNLPMKVDPASAVRMPARGNWVLVTGMFDHPAAQACGTDEADEVASRLQCRMEFVVTSATLAAE